ncbi:MAG: poly(3-hydroxybutyrate) depolymerase [Pseudohongiellaceae bacterium]|jgi:poly(3-hydroxybutyrate) depolymerase
MIIASLLLAWPLVLPVSAQLVDNKPVLDSVDAAHRAARIALTGDLGMAPLPPLTADSPLDSIIFADRVPVGDGVDTPTEGTAPIMMDGFIPSGPGGTGTPLPEIFKYQLPLSYTPGGPGLPLLVAYHGFGSSANSVGPATTLDEEANTRDMLYLSPTGIDDKLFGSPICQQHIEVAIQWMIDNFDVDEDRIYMVGFSMGGCVVANFASRHRDPEDIMIAAVGVISGTLDITQSWILGDAALKGWLENSYNFKGSPAQNAFNYLQASSVYFDPFSYLPLPGTLTPSQSMGSNLEYPPTYLTYDVDDTLVEVRGSIDQFDALLQTQGATIMKAVKSGTVDPDTGLPAPHSWAVLDEVEMLDFFGAVTVDRYPETFDAMLDLGGNIAWASTSQEFIDTFTYIDGVANPGAGSMVITNVTNASDVFLDASLAGISGVWSVHVTATSADVRGFTLHLTGFDQTPSYLLDATTGNLITLVDSDPASGSLIVEVPGNTTLDVNVISNSAWTGVITSSPNPTGLNQVTTIDVDLPATSASGWLIVAAVEQLYGAKGLTVTALAAPPAFIVPLFLDANGDTSFNTTIPNTPSLVGVRLPLQVIGLDEVGIGVSVTNLWGFSVQ